MTDDLDTLLTPPDAGSTARFDELLTASTRILRRRHQARRYGSLLAMLLIGGTAGWLLKPERIEQQVVYVATPTPPPTTASPIVDAVALTPEKLELRAELADDKSEVARYYREAGDKYLTEDRDYVQAARCYRLHLNTASTESRKFATSDSWLLMSMKSNTIKESPDANPGTKY